MRATGRRLSWLKSLPVLSTALKRGSRYGSAVLPPGAGKGGGLDAGGGRACVWAGGEKRLLFKGGGLA